MVQDVADDDWLLSPALAPLLAAMTRNGLVFDALVLPRHLPRLLHVVDHHLDLQFELDHCGKPRLATGEIAHLAMRHRLARRTPQHRLQTVGAVDGGRAGLADRGSTPAVDHVVTCFGPQRMLWGSDWPVVNLAGAYAKWFAAAETLLVDLSSDEKADIFGGNAARVYLASRRRRTS